MLEYAFPSLKEEERRRKSEAFERERLERLQLLKALFMSSDEYAVRQQDTGTEQQISASQMRDAALSRRHYDLAWDSFKLAVNYYMKAETLAEELDGMDASVEASPDSRARIAGSRDWCMRQADECFAKDHLKKKQKKVRRTCGAIVMRAPARARVRARA